MYANYIGYETLRLLCTIVRVISSICNLFAAPKCQDWALYTPRNGRNTCTDDGAGGWSCIASCDAGYYFFDEPYEAGTATPKTHTFTCTAGTDWLPSDYVPDCIGNNVFITLPPVSLNGLYISLDTTITIRPRFIENENANTR